jgi:hypothetical protein
MRLLLKAGLPCTRSACHVYSLPSRIPAAQRRARGHATTIAAGNNGADPPAATVSAVVTDAAVPEAHRGLHGFLYGEGGSEEAHGAPSSPSSDAAPFIFRPGEDDGASLLPVSSYLTSREGERPVGVYALHDSRGELQYVGLSRNIVLAVKAHLTRVGEDRCALIRPMVFANRAMQSRSALERQVENWLKEAGTTPPGNGAEQELWEGRGLADSVAKMSPSELTEYEEKKLKLQRAMGEKLTEASENGGKEDSAEERRQKIMRAVEGDDWSAVIDAQTQATLPANTATSAASSGGGTQGQIVTPFARVGVHRSVGQGASSGPQVEMTLEAVDKALDEVGGCIFFFTTISPPLLRTLFFLCFSANLAAFPLVLVVYHVTLLCCIPLGNWYYQLCQKKEKKKRKEDSCMCLKINEDKKTKDKTSRALLDLAAPPQVRPYLIADGGNVEVVGVEDGIVALRLQASLHIGI